MSIEHEGAIHIAKSSAEFPQLGPKGAIAWPQMLQLFCLLLERPVPVSDLMETTQPEHSVVQPTGSQELLSCCLDIHEGHLWVLVAVEDGHEHVAIHPHGLDEAAPQAPHKTHTHQVLN